MSSNIDGSYRILARALRQVITRPELKQKLKAQDTAEQAMEELKLTREMRIELLQVLTDLDREYETPRQASGEASNENEKPGKPQTEEEVNRARDFMDESFGQLRHAYRSSMLMSEIVFVIGIGFLLLAAAQSIRNPDDTATTSVIAGVGVIQIVALFYRKPLVDIARTVSNAQRTRVAITSYLVGIWMVGDQISLGPPTEKHVTMLAELTDQTIRRLQYSSETMLSEHPKQLPRSDDHPNTERNPSVGSDDVGGDDRSARLRTGTEPS